MPQTWLGETQQEVDMPEVWCCAASAVGAGSRVAEPREKAAFSNGLQDGQKWVWERRKEDKLPCHGDFERVVLTTGGCLPAVWL